VVSDNVISWAGDLLMDIQFVFTATVDYDASMYGQTITNSAEYSSDNAGSGSDSVGFELGTPVLSIAKSVATAHDPALPGDPITYTVVVRNDGTLEAENVHIWDALPDYVLGDDFDISTTIEAGTAYTITIPAQVALDAPVGVTLVNTAHFQWQEVLDESSASFTVSMARKIYLPYIMK
jgi:uncharacterized repeat protein (TIGR01451 family)